MFAGQPATYNLNLFRTDVKQEMVNTMNYDANNIESVHNAISALKMSQTVALVI